MNYRSRKLLTSRLRRALRWEFWPLWAFYPPVIIWIILLGIRYRSPLLFTAANPGMKAGGLVDENKSSNLLAIQEKYPEAVATTSLVRSPQACFEEIVNLKLSYPIILKPNNGQRGIGVKVVSDPAGVEAYFSDYPEQDTLLQACIQGLEFGVFYMREPDQAQGAIFSINEKQFPTLKGDGKHSLEELILEDSRQHYMAAFLLESHKDKLNDIPQMGETVELVEIGSHCRGSIFTEASELVSTELQQRVDQISKAIPGYFFGRYDLRVPNIEDFKAGKNLKILEANGVSSEAANIYDPSYGLIHAYRVLFTQWSAAFRIGSKNRDRGYPPASVLQVLKNWSQINQE